MDDRDFSDCCQYDLPMDETGIGDIFEEQQMKTDDEEENLRRLGGNFEEKAIDPVKES